MKRSATVKFPNSVQLFKFCQKVISHQKGIKVHDQEVGVILDFNPSDCSHWKRGEKSVRSVFALAKLAEHLNVDPGLVHDVASGNADLDEAFYEYLEAKSFQGILEKAIEVGSEDASRARKGAEAFALALHKQTEFKTAPLYLPEVFRFFSYIQVQPTEMMDKLSRILRIKAGHYSVQFKKGDLKAQTRMSMTKELARIVFEAERARFPELGKPHAALLAFEQMVFTAELLVPKRMMIDEMAKLDVRKNIVQELATVFWAPKSLISFQLQDILRSASGIHFQTSATANLENNFAANIEKTIDSSLTVGISE